MQTSIPKPVFSNPLKRLDRMQVLKSFAPVLAILFAFLMGGLVVLISKGDPLVTYVTLFRGAFGSKAGLENTIRYTLPILLLALSFSICARCGYFNIGQDGQIVSAAVMVTWLATLLKGLNEDVSVALLIIAAAIVGGLVALLPALFKLWLGVNEVVIAVLLNYLIGLFSTYLLTNPPIGDTDSSTIMSIVIEPKLGGMAIIVMVMMILLVYSFVLSRTVSGFRLRMVGLNRKFAETSGINPTRITIVSALIGGALAGLMAAGELLGDYHIMYDGFAVGLGSNGIIAALIGQHNPIGMILSSLVLGSLQSGSVLLAVATDVPAEIVQVVQGFVMLFATINFISVFVRKNKRSFRGD